MSLRVLCSETETSRLYGSILDELTTQFSARTRLVSIKAVQVTEQVLEQLGVQDKYFQLEVDFGDGRMSVKEGDWLTNSGYSIGQQEFSKSYVPKANARPKP